MPFGGLDWLALTQEPILEPELPICDPHHHFWDLRTARIPHQRYLLHELNDDIQGGHNVRTTVFIEARAMYRAGRPGGAAARSARSSSSRGWLPPARAASTARPGPPPRSSGTPT